MANWFTNTMVTKKNKKKYLHSVPERESSIDSWARGTTNSDAPDSHFLRSPRSGCSPCCSLPSSEPAGSEVFLPSFFPFSTSWALRFWFNLLRISLLLWKKDQHMPLTIVPVLKGYLNEIVYNLTYLYWKIWLFYFLLRFLDSSYVFIL